MKLLLNLLAAGSAFWLLAGTCHAQSSAPMDTVVSDSGEVSRVPAAGVKRWSRSRSRSAAAATELGSPPKGSTDFDVASVEADRARKAAKLSQAERERNAHIRPGSPDCRIKPVMSDAEIAACRGS